MKQKISVALAAIALGANAAAQDIYKMEQFSAKDLAGTSRFVGMGGAMNALGADLSTIAGNPAAIGMYRSSDIALTGGVTAQPNGEEFADISRARATFDQAGFVYSAKMGSEGVKFVNFAFNYQKSKNLKNYIGLSNIALGGLSQSLQMLDLSYGSRGWLDLDLTEDRELTTPLACLGYDTYMIDKAYDDEGNFDGYVPSSAQDYTYRRGQWGGIQQYDFNISFNVEDRVYAGLTVGAYNVNCHSYTAYAENLLDENGGLHPYYMKNVEDVSGNGFDLKLGAIFRPFEASPFRLGFAVHTPTFYDLETSSYLYMDSPYMSNGADHTSASVSVPGNYYKLRTPWKFLVSAATTAGKVFAIDAEYEFSNPSTARVSYGDYDYDWDWGWGLGRTDYGLKDEAKCWLKPVHTFRLGMEARLLPGVALRLGYNYQSSAFEKDAYLNLFTDSPSYYYQTNTDYVNLGDINRLTAGLGWRGSHWYCDFAYQYQIQKADVYPFHIPEVNSDVNRICPQEVQLNRQTAQLTIGYKF